MVCVFWEEWKMKRLLLGCFISHMQLCSLTKTHTRMYTLTEVAVEAQQERWQLYCLTNDFSPTSYPILSPSPSLVLSLSQLWTGYTDNDVRDKSAIRRLKLILLSCLHAPLKRECGTDSTCEHLCAPVLTHSDVSDHLNEPEIYFEKIQRDYTSHIVNCKYLQALTGK